jgi:hypothetical protein
MLLARDAGLVDGATPTSTSVSGKVVTNLDFHQYVRTPVRGIALEGGDNYFHPNASSKTPGKQDHNSEGNHRLDSDRTRKIIQHTSPASTLQGVMTAQVKNQKSAAEIAKGSVTGFDFKGRPLASDTEAQQDFAYQGGLNREIMKKIVKKTPIVFPEASQDPEAEELSSEDENFEVSSQQVEDALESPEKFSHLFSSLNDPKPRPDGWTYDQKKRGRSHRKEEAEKSEEESGSGSGSDQEESE